VNRNTGDAAVDARETALDAALARALPAPPVPAEFRAQLQAALARAEQNPELARAALERERLQRLHLLERGYRRFRRRVLGVLGGSALLAAAAIALLLPRFATAFGLHASVVLIVCGTVAGLIVAAASWARHMSVPALTELL
jgi:hypothetical protein